MIADVIQPLVRRAILDLMNEAGVEQNDEVLTHLLNAIGHRVARRDVAAELAWLGEQGLVRTEELGPFLVARILQDGRDVADGRLVVAGVRKHKTGE